MLWSPKVRRSIPILFAISMVVSIGMWLERFVIIPVSLHRDFLPGSWDSTSRRSGTGQCSLGTIGFFIFMMWLFIRSVPMINIFEMKDLLHKQQHPHDPHAGDGHETGDSTSDMATTFEAKELPGHGKAAASEGTS